MDELMDHLMDAWLPMAQLPLMQETDFESDDEWEEEETWHVTTFRVQRTALASKVEPVAQGRKTCHVPLTIIQSLVRKT